MNGDMLVQPLIAKLERDARDEVHSILGMLELTAQGPLTDAQYQHLRTCRSSADRLLRSVQNVYQFVCPETAQPLLAEIDLQEVVAVTASLMEESARRKGLSFKTEIRPGTSTRMTGDRHRIEDILVGLIDNSIRFTDLGGIELTLTSCESFSIAPRIEFIVCDSGPGIPEDTIAKVMNPLAPDHLVDGLGLPIVHQLVREMGGELSIVRPNGGGSRVVVSLALRPPDATGIPAVTGGDTSSPQSSIPLRLLNILVAEDSDQSYDVIESYLQEEGHQLTRAQNGAVAVDKFKMGGYDLVLMDVHMPVMDGYAATRAIRQWEITECRARVPIVVLSSDSPEIQRQNGAQAGCSGYITKPASKAVVLSSLKRFGGPDIQD